MNKAIFWDFDGTLSFPNKSFNDALYVALSEKGYNIDCQKTVKFLESAYSWRNPETVYIDKTGTMWWDTFFERIQDFCIMNCVSTSDIPEICKCFKELLIDVSNYKLYDDTVTVLQNCIDKGYKNYLVTNNYPEIIENLTKLGIEKFFADYVVSSHIGYEKPKMEFFDIAKEKANNPDVSYIVGDNPIADIMGGEKSGMIAIAVHECKNSEAKYYAQNLTDVLNIIE